MDDTSIYSAYNVVVLQEIAVFLAFSIRKENIKGLNDYSNHCGQMYIWHLQDPKAKCIFMIPDPEKQNNIYRACQICLQKP